MITEHIKMKLRQPELQRLYHNLEVMPSNFQIRGMHTLIRDRTTSKADFVFYADRLLRLVCIRPVHCCCAACEDEQFYVLKCFLLGNRLGNALTVVIVPTVQSSEPDEILRVPLLIF